MYDGTGHSIHIPTIMVPYRYGQELIKVFEEKESSELQFILKADLEISQRNKDIMEYEFFYGSLLDIPTDLVFNLYKY